MPKLAGLVMALSLVACGDNTDPPPVFTASSTSLSTAEDTPLTIDVSAIDAHGDPLIYTVVQPAHGTVTGDGPTFTYTPVSNYDGTDTITITVASALDRALSSTLTFTVTVTSVDDAPQATDLTATTNENQGVAIELSATDVDSTTFTFAVIAQPQHGTITGHPPAITYTPSAGYFGSDSLQYIANDGELDSQPATVMIAISSHTTCGDGVVQGGEQCDDGNTNNNDGCLNNCMLATCGDGVVRTGLEQCDDGNADNTDACLDTCVVATCGDGFVRAGIEQCDDANHSNNDACLNTCMNATCGDGFVRIGVEQCDDANASNNDACLNTCQIASCGDGFIEVGVEQCDDANQSNNDGCLNSCAEAACGDGFVQIGVEQCDDGNQSNNDACLNTCAIATCGDGFVFTGFEQCDDGNRSNNDACLNTCVNAFCGDGFVRIGFEQCDDANASNTDSCLNTCVIAGCGDGFVEAGVEQCDDGNNSNSDACLNTCQSASCGDGFVEAGVEQCDDGNNTNNDACPNNCALPVCGDGILNPGEECDDGNTNDDDGCGHSCKIERCGDGLVQFNRGEECDDGNTVSNDGCDSSCLAETYVTTPSVLVSGEGNCTTGIASSTHKVAVDSDGRIYAVFMCGSSGFTVVSYDRGQTFSTPFDLSATSGDADIQISQIAVATGEVSTAYVALLLTSGSVVLRTSNDFGTTWGPMVPIGTASNTSSGLSLDAFNDDVFVGFETSSGVSVFHSRNQGSSFTSSLAPLTTADFDLVYDVRTTTVTVAASSPPSFRVLTSSDMGKTWSSEVNPPGQEFFSDWAASNGQLYTSGTNIGILGNSTQLYVIPTSSPSTSTAISGLPQVTTLQSRSLTADAAGNVYVSSQLDGGGIRLDRLQFGAVSFDASHAVSPNGTEPVAAALPGSNGVAIEYTVAGSQVWLTVQSYAGGGGG